MPYSFLSSTTCAHLSMQHPGLVPPPLDPGTPLSIQKTQLHPNGNRDGSLHSGSDQTEARNISENTKIRNRDKIAKKWSNFFDWEMRVWGSRHVYALSRGLSKNLFVLRLAGSFLDWIGFNTNR